MYKSTDARKGNALAKKRHIYNIPRGYILEQVGDIVVIRPLANKQEKD